MDGAACFTAGGMQGTIDGNTVAFEVLLPVRAGAWCQVQYEAIASDSGDANWTWTANDAYKGFDGTHMEAQYVGPPLANDN